MTHCGRFGLFNRVLNEGCWVSLKGMRCFSRAKSGFARLVWARIKIADRLEIVPKFDYRHCSIACFAIGLWHSKSYSPEQCRMSFATVMKRVWEVALSRA